MSQSPANMVAAVLAMGAPTLSAPVRHLIRPAPTPSAPCNYCKATPCGCGANSYPAPKVDPPSPRGS